MTNYVNYNELKKGFIESGKKDAIRYLIAIASILAITSGVYYFIG